MSIDITNEFAKKEQKEAEWAYNKAIEKFYYSMLEVVFLRIKSHLSAEGLNKVVQIDKKRVNNENLGVEFSQKTWSVLAEAWTGAEGLAMTRSLDFMGWGYLIWTYPKFKRLMEMIVLQNANHQTNFDVHYIC